MEYISSDTNIWIDYMVIDRLDLPFRLPLTYLMNKDAIEDELLSPNGLKDELLRLGLKSTELTEKEFYYGIEMVELHPKLSRYDCAALAIAKYRKIVLLTGDAELRKVALSENVSVMGTIGILDRLYEYDEISLVEYRECLSRLNDANGREVRLPKVELQNRLEAINNNMKDRGDAYDCVD